jgi:hypothetical protein
MEPDNGGGRKGAGDLARPVVKRLKSIARDVLAAGSYGPAADLFALLAEVDPDDPSSMRREVEALIALHRFDDAIDRSRRVIASQAVPSGRDIVALCDALLFLGRRKEAAEAVMAHAQLWAAHLTATQAPRGSMVVVAALPKSGSTSLTQGLATALGLIETEFLNLRTEQSFAFRDPVLRAYWPLEGFGLAVHSHLSPDADPLRRLVERARARVFLHIRDPREALLSTIAMAARIHPPNVLLKCPNFLFLPAADQLDWMIDHYLPDQVSWVEGWRAILADAPDLIAGVSTHYDMVAEGHDGLSRRLATAAGLEVQAVASTVPRRFETGRTGHWAEVATDGQSARAAEVLGPDLISWLEDRRRMARV